MRKNSQSVGVSLLQLTAVIGLLWSLAAAANAQEKRTKARISNTGFTITALPLLAAKDEIRKSKAKTVDLIVRVLKMDKEAAAETYDQFLTTLSPSGIPSRTGMETLVKAIQSQGRFVGRKVSFTDIADDRLAAGVAKEMGYNVH